MPKKPSLECARCGTEFTEDVTIGFVTCMRCRIPSQARLGGCTRFAVNDGVKMLDMSQHAGKETCGGRRSKASEDG